MGADTVFWYDDDDNIIIIITVIADIMIPYHHHSMRVVVYTFTKIVYKKELHCSVTNTECTYNIWHSYKHRIEQW